MRQEPIEIAMAGTGARKRPAARTTANTQSARSTNDACVVDEVFARFDGPSGANAKSEPADRRLMKQELVSDLAAQLEAIDRQRERLAQLLQSIETNSIAE